MAKDSKPPPGKDLIRFGPKVGENQHLFVRHRPDHSLETGVAQPMGEEARDEARNYDGLLRVSGEGPVYDVAEVLWERERAEAESEAKGSGPAMVNSAAYRDGWDNIFGNKTVGEA